MSPKLKLTIELVPSTAWYNNLRSLMTPRQWDLLRKKVYADYHHRCGICDSQSRLDCHEIWQYDDTNHIQRLTGLIALCHMCHQIKHIGLSELVADQRNLNFDSLIKHFMKVNHCDRQTFLNHKKTAFDIWTERSQHEWQMNIGDYSNIGSFI